MTRCVLCHTGAFTKLKRLFKIPRNFTGRSSFLCAFIPRFYGSGLTLFSTIALEPNDPKGGIGHAYSLTYSAFYEIILPQSINNY